MASTGKRARDCLVPEDEDCVSPDSKRRKGSGDAAEAGEWVDVLCRVLFTAAQAGYAEDVFPAASICKTLYNDQSLWTLLSNFRAAPRMGIAGSPTPVQKQGRIFHGYRTPLMAAVHVNNAARVVLILSWFQKANSSSSAVSSSAAFSSASGTPASSSSSSSSPVDSAAAMVGAIDAHGKTALHRAAELGNAAVVALLLNQGRANPNTPDYEGRTPLHICCMPAVDGGCTDAQRLAVAKALLAENVSPKANVKAINPQGQTPLDLLCTQEALEKAKGSPEREQLICLLLRAGATVVYTAAVFNAACRLGLDILAEILVDTGQICANGAHSMLALRLRSKAATTTSSAPSASSSASSSASASALGASGSSAASTAATPFPLYRPGPEDWPLLVAIKQGKEKLALRLLEDEAADPDFGAGCKQSPLALAAASGSVDLVERLLAKGANVNTALHAACSKGQTGIARMLVTAGADVNKTNRKGHRPFESACLAGKDEELALFLLERGTDVSSAASVDLPASQGFARAVEWIVRKRLLAGYSVSSMESALHCAVQAGQADVCRVLMSAGVKSAPPTTVTTDHSASLLVQACALADKPGVADVVIKLLEPEAASSSSSMFSSAELSCALEQAAKCGSEAAVEALLARGAFVTHQGKKGKTALYKACSKGHGGVVRLLLAAGADPNVCSSEGRSPLFVAASKGQVSAVKALVETKATPPLDVDLTCEAAYGNTVFELLVTGGIGFRRIDKASREDIIISLVDAGADLEKTGLTNQEDFDSTVTYCVESGWDRVVIKLLKVRESRLARPPSADGKEEGRRLSSNAAAFRNAIWEGREELAMQLLPNLKRTHEEPSVGMFAAACEGGMLRVVGGILALGFDPSRSDLSEHPQTPLQAASYKGRLQVTSALLRAGADSAERDVDGQTALHLACMGGHAKVVSLLLIEGKSDANVKDVNGQTPLALALTQTALDEATILALLAYEGEGRVNVEEHVLCPGMPGSESIAKLMLWRPIHVAASKGLASVVLRLLELGVSIDREDHLGRTPLMQACATGRADIAAALLAKSANVHRRSFSGDTALSLAAKAGSTAIVCKLLAAGANKDTRDLMGATPLMDACMSSQGAVAKILADSGASVAIKTVYGCRSALRYACLQRSADCLKALLDAGVIQATSKEDLHNALEAACRSYGDSTIAMTSSFMDQAFRLVLGADLLVSLEAAGAAIAVKHHDAATAFLRRPSKTADNSQSWEYFSSVCSHISKALQNGMTRTACTLLERVQASRYARPAAWENFLLEACRQGSLSFVKKVLSLGTEPTQAVLIEACRLAVPAITRALLLTQAGCGFSLTPAMSAALLSGRTSQAMQLLMHAERTKLEALRPDARSGESNETLLHLALKHRNLSVFAKLIIMGAQLSLREASRETPLHLACRLRDSLAVEVLSTKGAKVNRRGKGEKRPLGIAIEAERPTGFGHAALIVRQLLATGAKVKAANLRNAVAGGQYNVCSLLLQAGANPSAPYWGSAVSPLVRAVLQGREDIVALLLQFKAEPNTAYLSTSTALVTSCLPGLPAAVTELLLKGGATVEMEDRRGWSALRTACVAGSREKIALLLRHGADPKAAGKAGLSPLRLYRAFGALMRPLEAEATIKLLIDAGAVDDAESRLPVREAELPPHPAGTSALLGQDQPSSKQKVDKAKPAGGKGGEADDGDGDDDAGSVASFKSSSSSEFEVETSGDEESEGEGPDIDDLERFLRRVEEEESDEVDDMDDLDEWDEFD